MVFVRGKSTTSANTRASDERLPDQCIGTAGEQQHFTEFEPLTKLSLAVVDYDSRTGFDAVLPRHHLQKSRTLP